MGREADAKRGASAQQNARRRHGRRRSQYGREMATLPLYEWMQALGLDSSKELLLLHEWGVEQPSDLIYLEAQEIELLGGRLKLVQKRKLQRAIKCLKELSPFAEIHNESAITVDGGDDTNPISKPGEIPVHKDSTVGFDFHHMILRRFIDNDCRKTLEPQSILTSLNACWKTATEHPPCRAKILSLLFHIAKCSSGSMIGKEAGLALVFLAFSRSGTQVKAHAPVRSHPGVTKGPNTVLILGWLGASVTDFEAVVQNYQKQFPHCTVVVTVGGNDTWPESAIDYDLAPKGLKTTANGGLLWPSATASNLQLQTLASHVATGRVLIHSFRYTNCHFRCCCCYCFKIVSCLSCDLLLFQSLTLNSASVYFVV
jgi:hypothetical protein